MSVQGITITLTTAPTVIAGDGNHGVLRVRLINRGTGTGYLGGASVTTSGYPMTTADTSLEFTLATNEVLYGTSTGAASAIVLRYNDTTN